LLGMAGGSSAQLSQPLLEVVLVLSNRLGQGVDSMRP
jgi:hypothetical protein